MMSQNKSTICIHSDIFHQPFSLRITKFIIQYFRSLLFFGGPLSESEFLVVFSFRFPVIYQQVYSSIQTFKLVNYSLTSNFRGLGSRVSLANFGDSGPEFHFRDLGSWVPLDHIGVPGLGSYFSGMPMAFITIFLMFF